MLATRCPRADSKKIKNRRLPTQNRFDEDSIVFHFASCVHIIGFQRATSPARPMSFILIF